MAFDRKQFAGIAQAFEEGIEIEIKSPAGEKTGLFIQVASYQSERVRKVQRRMADAALREQKRNPKRAMTTEELEQRATDVIAAAIVSWRGFEDGDQPYACTADNIRSVLTDPDLFFIAEQVDKAAEDQASFIKA